MKKNKIAELKSKLPTGDKASKGPIVEANIEEHREQTLKSAKKFKYPMQQAKHKILAGAVAVFVLALVILVTASWWQLYDRQNLGDFYYTATKFVPISVADVDGEPVSYSSYMRRVRASIHYLENQDNRDLSTEDGLRELEHTKRVNMNEAEKVALAGKVAKDRNLTVSDDEIAANIEKTLNSQSGGAISQRAFENSLWRYYGWSMDDYRQITRERLLVRKASFAIDSTARTKAGDLKRQIDSGADFGVMATDNSDDDITKANGGDVGTVALDNSDDDGLIATAKELQPGGVSSVIEGVNAFYIIKLVGKSDSTVHYLMIKISLNAFDKQFQDLKNQGKINEYIEINGEE
jgi:hypothetical protein